MLHGFGQSPFTDLEPKQAVGMRRLVPDGDRITLTGWSWRWASLLMRGFRDSSVGTEQWWPRQSRSEAGVRTVVGD